jgi:hypothetical protein
MDVARVVSESEEVVEAAEVIADGRDQREMEI